MTRLKLATGTSILLAICAISMSAGCASASRLSRNLLQSPLGARHAAVIPGSWDGVFLLRPGVRMFITLMDGSRLEGNFRTLRPGDLGVTGSAGREFDVQRSNIRQIVVRGDPDSVTNGALIGAGIGLATAATILAIAASGDGYVLPSAKWGAPLLLSAAGALIGVFVDRAQRDDRLVYVRP